MWTSACFVTVKTLVIYFYRVEISTLTLRWYLMTHTTPRSDCQKDTLQRTVKQPHSHGLLNQKHPIHSNPPTDCKTLTHSQTPPDSQGSIHRNWDNLFYSDILPPPRWNKNITVGESDMVRHTPTDRQNTQIHSYMLLIHSYTLLDNQRHFSWYSRIVRSSLNRKRQDTSYRSSSPES